jgi:hypothetical protein
MLGRSIGGEDGDSAIASRGPAFIIVGLSDIRRAEAKDGDLDFFLNQGFS